MNALTRLPLLLVAISLCSLPGCRDTTIEDAIAAANSSHIQQLYNCYSLFCHQNKYRGPKDETELKEFLQNPRYEKNLKLMQINRDALDEMFVSERDGEPFKVRYGVNGLGNKAVIFESTGIDGKRMVALENPTELSAEEYEAYWSGKKRPIVKIPTEGPPQ